MPKRKTRRRGNGEGSPYKRKDGQWCAAIRIGGPGGKRVVRYAATRELVMLKLDQLRNDARRGIIPTRHRTTDLETVKTWVSRVVESSVAPGTKVSGRIALAKIEPVLGHRPLHLVTTLEVDEWLRRLECGTRAKQIAYDLLKRSFKQAVEQKRIDSSPMTGIRRPAHRPKPHRPFTASEASRLLAALRDHRLFGVFAMILSCGMRQGEILGARWSDVDWAAGVLTIRQGVARGERGEVIIRQPKNQSSVREVPLTEDAVRILLGRALHARQEGLHECELMFPTKAGTPLSTGNLRNQVLRPKLIELGIAERGLHSGRHSACTFMLRGGVPLHIVSGVLGHANAHITSQIYSHCLEGDTAAAINSLSGMIGYNLATRPPAPDRSRKEKTNTRGQLER